MTLTDFKAEHLVLLDMQDNHDTRKIDRSKLIEEGKALEGLSFTLTNNGTIVGCGGLKPLWDGVYEGWVVASKSIESHPIEAVRKTQECLGRLITDKKIRRIQALVLSGFDAGIRFARMLGFEHEGDLRRYGTNGEDYKMFSIVR